MKISTILKIVIVFAVFWMVFTHSLTLPEPDAVLGDSTTKVFHTLDCQNLREGLDKTSEGQRLLFSSRDKAIKAGYKPCEVCEP